MLRAVRMLEGDNRQLYVAVTFQGISYWYRQTGLVDERHSNKRIVIEARRNRIHTVTQFLM